MNKNNTLIFVYNADASFFSQLTDYIHKSVSPSTYQCKLCVLTYGATGMKKEWKAFIQNFALPVKFLHKDEFIKRYPKFSKIPLPAAFMDKDGSISQVITAQEINTKHTIAELEKLVKEKLQ